LEKLGSDLDTREFTGNGAALISALIVGIRDYVLDDFAPS
jgi:hypothetical protein